MFLNSLPRSVWNHWIWCRCALNGSKGAGNKSRILVWPCTMTDDFSIEQVDQHANIMPLVLNLHIRQIANDEALGFRLLKFTSQHICCLCFIAGRLVGLIRRLAPALSWYGQCDVWIQRVLVPGAWLWSCAYRRLCGSCGISPQSLLWLHLLSVVPMLHSTMYFLRFAGRRTLLIPSIYHGYSGW